MAITLDGTSGINTSGTLVATGSLTTSSSLTTGTGAVYNGLQTSTAQATTSGTSKTISDVPAWAKRITIYFNGVTCSGNTTMVLNSVSTGYNNTQSRLNATGTVTNSNASGSSFTMTQNAPSASFAKYTLTLVNASTNVYVLDGYMQGSTNFNLTLGAVTVGATLTSITIAGGTFSAGEIDVIYE